MWLRQLIFALTKELFTLFIIAAYTIGLVMLMMKLMELAAHVI